MLCVQTFAYQHVVPESPWYLERYFRYFTSREFANAWIANMFACLTLSVVS